MANFFYYDENGQKQGPFTPDEVKSLAAWGQITPETVMKTDTGKSGKAGQIKGLQFSTPLGPSPFIRPVSAADNPLTGTVPQPLPSPQKQPIPAPAPVQPDGTVPLHFIIGGVIALLFVIIGLASISGNNGGSGTSSSDTPRKAITAVVHQSADVLHKVKVAYNAKRHDDCIDAVQQLVHIDVTRCPPDAQTAFRKFANSVVEYKKIDVEMYIDIELSLAVKGNHTLKHQYMFDGTTENNDWRRSLAVAEEAFEEWKSVQQKYGVFIEKQEQWRGMVPGGSR